MAETAFYFESDLCARNWLDDTSIKVIYLLNSKKEDASRHSEVCMYLPPNPLHCHTDGLRFIVDLRQVLGSCSLQKDAHFPSVIASLGLTLCGFAVTA